MNGFWAGGASAYREALEDEFRNRMAQLSDELAAAPAADVEKIQRVIDEERASFRYRCARVGELLF
jgi:hypothetical protein